jgi:polyisoprenoid-binding protein YceI
VDSATRIGHAHAIAAHLAAGVLALGKSGELAFDLTSLQADTPETRQVVGLDPAFPPEEAQKATEISRSAQVLDIARFPRATFAIGSIAPLDGQPAGEPGQYMLTGHLALHGVVQPLRVRAMVERSDQPGALRLRGSFFVLQTDYGIRPHASLGGLSRVANRVQIWGDVGLVPAPQ